jgi:hypothetical protein
MEFLFVFVVLVIGVAGVFFHAVYVGRRPKGRDERWSTPGGHFNYRPDEREDDAAPPAG